MQVLASGYEVGYESVEFLDVLREVVNRIGWAWIAFYFLLYAYYIVCKWIILHKAGEHGWAVLVPFYGQWCHFRSCWGSGATMFLTLIPIVGNIMMIVDCWKMATAYGRGAGFGWGLFLLNPIFLGILAFDRDIEYEGPPFV